MVGNVAHEHVSTVLASFGYYNYRPRNTVKSKLLLAAVELRTNLQLSWKLVLSEVISRFLDYSIGISKKSQEYNQSYISNDRRPYSPTDQ